MSKRIHEDETLSCANLRIHPSNPMFISKITPTGCLDVKSPTTIEAKFSNTNGCTCSCLEYRRYVRGQFLIDGKRIPHLLGGTNTLSIDTPREDCANTSPVYCPGHRTLPKLLSHALLSDHYIPDRKSGCKFVGFDVPGICNIPKGISYEILLDFDHDIVDICRNALVATKHVSLHFKGVA